jgi:uncharacterized protein (TIGR01777 family)
MPTVLITGGTGLLGRAMTDLLTGNGFEVIILTRSLERKTSTKNISFALWDVKSGQIDIPALQRADHIIHLAGAGVMDEKWTADYKKEIVESRTESSRLISDTLIKIEHKVQTIVSASAIGWYGEDKFKNKAFTEDDPADAGFLGDTCRLWEAAITGAENAGVRVCKIRIGILLSNDGGAFAEFVKPLKFGVAAILGNGRQYISWIHIDDVCRIFLHAIENTNMSGSYNAVSPAPVTNEYFIMQTALALKGKDFIAVHIPTFVLKTMLGQRSVEILKSATVSCTKIKTTGFQFLYPSLESALSRLAKKD